MRRLLQRLFQSVSEVYFAKVEHPSLTYFKLAMKITNPYLQFTRKCPLWSGPVERFKRLQKSATKLNLPLYWYVYRNSHNHGY